MEGYTPGPPSSSQYSTLQTDTGRGWRVTPPVHLPPASTAHYRQTQGVGGGLHPRSTFVQPVQHTTDRHRAWVEGDTPGPPSSSQYSTLQTDTGRGWRVTPPVHLRPASTAHYRQTQGVGGGLHPRSTFVQPVQHTTDSTGRGWRVTPPVHLRPASTAHYRQTQGVGGG